MNYGMYLSAASLQVGHLRMDVLANNMANINTTSFKPDVAVVRTRRPAPVELNLPSNLTIPVLDDIGGGLSPDGTYTDFAQGPIVRTGQELDVALQGDGFFAVQVDDEVRYTRDGRFTRDREGYLATAANGYRVLDDSGRPILLQPGDVTIDARGWVHAGGAEAALNIIAFRNPSALRKAGNNTFIAGDQAGATASTASVNQRFLEGSRVEPTRTLVDMITAQRTYEASARLIQSSDSMLGRAVNDIARLA